MALIVEDGSGVADAESYGGLPAFKVYLQAYGLAAPAGATDADLEVALRRGSTSLDMLYGGVWLGRRATAVQALDWPRREVIVDGAYLPTSPLPRALLYATFEAAWREAAAPGALLPDFDPGQRVTSETVGPISVDYAAPSDAELAGVGVTFTVLDKLLARLTSGTANTLGGAAATFLLRG